MTDPARSGAGRSCGLDQASPAWIVGAPVAERRHAFEQIAAFLRCDRNGSKNRR
jgi:hypothetical protein